MPRKSLMYLETCVKHFFTKLLIFIVLGLVIHQLLRTYSLKAWDACKDGASVICEKKRKFVRDGGVRYKNGKVNVVFMGHSKILAGIIPRYFDTLTNNKAYSFNLSLPGLPIAPHYFVLKDYLEKTPPPEYIVLHLSVNTGKSDFFDKYAFSDKTHLNSEGAKLYTKVIYGEFESVHTVQGHSL